MLVVVKIGTSSLTAGDGSVDVDAINKLGSEVAGARRNGHDVLIVTSGAITAGLPAMGFSGERPSDTITLQAAAAVGQSRLLRAYDDALAPHGLIGGQILLTPNDFFERRQYLHVRDALSRLLQLGIVPIVNENDAVADDEIHWSDNDRIAALVAHSVGAGVLVLLTDTAGMFTSDPRFDETASLVEEIIEIDHELEVAAGGAGTAGGSGGMASKLAAARMASHSGVRTVIAAATRPSVLTDAIDDLAGVGTTVHARSQRLGARKLWIAFAVAPAGRVVVDQGARRAVVDSGGSLLPAGVVAVEGSFDTGDAVEVIDESQAVFAKGLVACSSENLAEVAGKRTSDLPAHVAGEVIHRDDLVVLV